MRFRFWFTESELNGSVVSVDIFLSTMHQITGSTCTLIETNDARLEIVTDWQQLESKLLARSEITGDRNSLEKNFAFGRKAFQQRNMILKDMDVIHDLSTIRRYSRKWKQQFLLLNPPYFLKVFVKFIRSE